MKKEAQKANHVIMVAFEKHGDFMALQFKKVFEKLDQHDTYFVKIFEKLDQHDKYFVKIFETFEQHDRVFEIMLKELQKTNQEAKDHRMMMSDLNRTDVSHYRKIEGLELRIEKLEAKVK